MSKIFISHYEFHKDEQGLTRSVTVTTHCTRRDMLEMYAELCLADPKYADVYIGEDCVIIEVRI